MEDISVLSYYEASNSDNKFIIDSNDNVKEKLDNKEEVDNVVSKSNQPSTACMDCRFR